LAYGYRWQEGIFMRSPPYRWTVNSCCCLLHCSGDEPRFHALLYPLEADHLRGSQLVCLN
jgi:hypothetical protein